MPEESFTDAARPESSMLTVAPEAALILHAALADEIGSGEHAIRISLDTKRRMRIAMGDVRADDKKIVFKGRIILIAEPDVASAIAGQTLSICSSGEGSAFVLRPTPDRVVDAR